MENIKTLLKDLFQELNKRINILNQERRTDGAPIIKRAEIKLLGQISLLVNDKVSAILSLAQTGDVDAWLNMDHVAKNEFKSLLKNHGLIYDEDSSLVWVPKDAKFEKIFDFENILVLSIDPESALVSKAVKAPQKNMRLIREAIASQKFINLADRILEHGGKLESFIGD